MPGIAIGLFFILGLVLSLVGYFWGLVQAFGEETIWGVLYLLVPCAALVFYIKNWQDRKTRKTFLIKCSGLLMFVLGGVTTSVAYGANFVKSSQSGLNVELKNNDQSSFYFPAYFNTSPSETQELSPGSESSPQGSAAPGQKYDFKQSMKLGYTYYGQGDYQTALINFNRALQIRPGDAYVVKAVYNTKSAIVQGSVK
ncbi:tetratricopeptide repeat protein [Microcoleus vaginatus GB1-A2]|uniref:tetratricopeptide repeat protein n=1 Tax=Microcoleus vaginatus TaxID=119532 RepID=UPI001685FA8A|nr:tetratricopeptide repeat protein [Microcoleus sp. FACHB-61]